MVKIFNRFLIVLCTIAIVSFIGCGTKGPPLAPLVKGQEISSPVNLKYKAVGDQISLFWNHNVDEETAVVKPEGFEVFMVKKTFEDCEGCPFEFKKIGYVAMPSMELVVPIEKGFKYYFRLQAVDGEMKSDYSKTVQFEYK
jgi:hypothetical protein